MSLTFKFSIFAMAIAVSAAPVVCAQAGAERTSIRVAYGDLDLSTRAGATTLLNRMEAATRQVCGAKPSPMKLAALRRHNICAREAMSRAVAAVDSPVLTTLFAGKSGEQSAAR